MIAITLLVGILFWIGVDVWAGTSSRWYTAVKIDPTIESNNFSVLVPIYGNVAYLQNVEFLRPYGNRIVLCTTSGETAEFYQALEEIAVNCGFKIFRSSYVPRTMGRKKSTRGLTRDTIVRDALNNVQLNAYTICLDADTTADESLGSIVGALIVNNADFASVQIVTQKDGPAIVQLQRHEYILSMRARRIMPWLLSGAFHLGRTDVMRLIMQNHSLFFQGNDVETGILGDAMGFKSVHIMANVNTNVPDTLYAWWRQRIAWSAGSFRLFIVNFRFIFRHPFLWAYSGIIVIFMFALRWFAILTPGWTLLLALVFYYIAMIWLHWDEGSKWLLFQPFYSLFVSLFVVPVGIVYYFIMAIPERNFGLIRLRRSRKVTPQSLSSYKLPPQIGDRPGAGANAGSSGTHTGAHTAHQEHAFEHTR